VRFSLDPHDDARLGAAAGGAVRFGIELLDRASNAFDWLAMTVGGNQLQDATWREIVDTVVAESGGAAPDGVQSERTTLEGDEAREAERWVEGLVEQLRKREHEDAVRE
jgi:hypothetical protein